MRRSPAALVVAVALVSVLSNTACSNDDAPVDTAGAVLPVVPDEAPGGIPVDDSPFCRAMLEVGTVEGDGSLDDLVARFVDVADEVPAEIRPDFDVVLERLVIVAAGDEVTDPARADESANELAIFIELHCRNTAMNPLPPPSVPDAPADDS